MTKDLTLGPQPVLGATHYALMCLEKGDTAGAKHVFMRPCSGWASQVITIELHQEKKET